MDNSGLIHYTILLAHNLTGSVYLPTLILLPHIPLSIPLTLSIPSIDLPYLGCLAPLQVTYS